MKKIAAIMAIALTIASGAAFAHGGRTNSSGCHNDHSNGTYHCH